MIPGREGPAVRRGFPGCSAAGQGCPDDTQIPGGIATTIAPYPVIRLIPSRIPGVTP